MGNVVLPDILSNLDAARRVLARRPSALMTDVDGTISPIAPTPEQAYVPETIKRVLVLLAARLDLVVAVSGRPASDVRERLGLDQIAYSGNHGLEVWRQGQVELDPEAAPFLPVVEAAARAAAERLSLPGVRVEPKGITASIHYRQSGAQGEARAAILKALEEVPKIRELRVTEGRMVVNILPPIERNKGTAIAALAAEHRLEGIVYLGDDVTDMDAFSALRNLRARGVSTVAIAVVSGESPRGLLESADFQANGVDGVQQFFEALATGSRS